MTKQQRIEQFNEKWVNWKIIDEDCNSLKLCCYIGFLFDDEVSEEITALTEAKEIMELEDDE